MPILTISNCPALCRVGSAFLPHFLEKGFDGIYRLGLLLLGRDGSRRVPFLRAIVAKLGVVASFNLYNIFRILDVVFHALIQRAVNRQRVFRRIVTIEVCSQQNQAVHLVRMFSGKLGSHRPAHGVSGNIPVLIFGELRDHLFRCVGIKNCHVEGHMYQNAGDSPLLDLVKQRQVGFPTATILQGTEEDVREAVRRCVAAGNNKTIISSGCEIPRMSPEANVTAIAQELKLPGQMN